MEPMQTPDGTPHEDGASQDAATYSDRRVSPGTIRTGSHQTHGHHYEAFTIQDNARVHTGDVHSSQHTHYHGAPPPHPHAKETSLLDALSFEQMDFRSATIAPAYAKTCDWLFSAAAYQRWRNQDLVSEHNGFLWIKGKPGAGKSTLIKHAWEHAKVTYEHETTISFFFNARGAALGKSVEGMYRCLLHQMVDQMPQLERRVSNADRSAYRSKGWPIAVLQDLFRQAIFHLSRHTRLSFYIDALDEGHDEDQVRAMVEFFYELVERAVSDGMPFYVCLASRYYPKVSVSHFEELRLEHHGGHDADISDYVRNKLRLEDDDLKNQLSAEIEHRSSGVFLWVVLVVAMLNKEGDRGNQHLLVAQLREIPDGLLQLIEDLQNRDASDNRFSPAIQWVLYALRPLEPQVLYIAILTSIGELAGESVIENQQLRNIETINDFIISSSKGLLEIRFGDIPSPSDSFDQGQFGHDSGMVSFPIHEFYSDYFEVPFGRPGKGFIVQFIHEVVREYFLGVTGFGLEHIEGQSMSALSSDAQQQQPSDFRRSHVRATLVSQVGTSSAPPKESDDEPITLDGLEGRNVGLTELGSGSFRGAAAITHNRFSQTCQTYIRTSHAQNQRLPPARFPGTETQATLPRTFLEYSLEMALRHAEIASENGCRVRDLSQNFPWDEWVFYKSAEHSKWAAYYKEENDDQWKSAAHAKSADDYRQMYTWLQMMAYEDHPRLIRDELLSIGSGTEHSRRGREEYDSLLNACCKGLGSALHISALRNKNVHCLELLLDGGADVNKMYKGVGSPLHSASKRQTDAALLLLQRGADATTIDDRGNSALHVALLTSNYEIVRELSEHGANLHGRVGVFRNAAQTVGQLNEWMFMRALSDFGVDVDANDFSREGPYKDPQLALLDWSVTKAPMTLRKP